MNPLELLHYTFINESAIENFLRNCSFCTLLVSMMFYWIQTAFSFSGDIPNAEHPLPLLGGGGVPFRGWRGGSLKINFGTPEWAPFFFMAAAPEALAGGVTSSEWRGEERKVVPVYPSDPPRFISFGTITMILSNLVLMSLLIFRWRESGHFPLSNLYESLMFLSWSCTCIHLILEYNTTLKKVRPEAILLTKLIGSITSPSALFTNAFATISLPLEMQKASPLVPALQSNWLMMHVTVMIISYSALILGSLLSIAFLILINVDASAQEEAAQKNLNALPLNVPSLTAQEASLKKNCIASKNISLKGGSFLRSPLPNFFRGHALLRCVSKASKKKGVRNHPLGRFFFSLSAKSPSAPFFLWAKAVRTYPSGETPYFVDAALTQQGERGGAPHWTTSPLVYRTGPPRVLIRKNTLAWNFDNLSYRVVGIGFPFLTIGILSGAVWANEAWGSYWSWDPKETWALLTWLIFAIYLHARITKGWQGKKPAIIASFGFLAIWICFLGVNLIGEGLHSYGWFS